jgi:hypothetical protein
LDSGKIPSYTLNGHCTILPEILIIYRHWKLKMKSVLLALTLVATLTPFTSYAGETANGQNYLVLENQAWPTVEKSGFYQFNGSGISNVANGPTETSAIECHGSGFWSPEGNRAEGICLHGADDDTYVSAYKRELGAENGQWEILGGTGKYAGISGEGTYVPRLLPGNRAISNWQGEISLGE